MGIGESEPGFAPNHSFGLSTWKIGAAPVAVVMISLNEAHNMEAVLQNLSGWAQEVFLVDSYSSDQTVDIALRHGVHVVQRRFRGFGDQWNFALRELPIAAPWTMKLDPDERLTKELKAEIARAIDSAPSDGYRIPIRLFFMGKALPIRLVFTRLWRTGCARFSAVLANEHALVDGVISDLESDIEHHDSPDLGHWLEKQNRYTTAEAISSSRGAALSAEPKLFGSSFQRRMWFKKHLFYIPGRFSLIFLHNYLWLGAWRAGWVGYVWSRLRSDVYRIWEYKLAEIRLTGREPMSHSSGHGTPDERVRQY